MENLLQILKNAREEKQLPLRLVASEVGIDLAVLSKIENGKRTATREQVVKLASYYNLPESELLIAWLSEKIQYEISNEEVGLEALKVAEAAVMYQTKYAFSFENMIQTIREFLQKDGRISVAYLFGSFARGENTAKSDVDICVEFNDKKKYSLFDLIDISHILEKGVHRKVDIVEKGSIKDFALQSASNDFIKIYG